MPSATTPDGTTIVFEDSPGSEPAVVLVHGITESRASWAPIIERLSPTQRVVALDLRGHGESGAAARYDLEAMASDVITVATSLGLVRPHLVGHSLGGAVVSAVGAAMPVASVVNVDQSLQLGGFKEGLTAIESMLRDETAFGAVMHEMFAGMAGSLLSESETARLTSIRRPDQTVVLGVWDVLLSQSAEQINGVIEAALAGYASSDADYLSLFGIDPGPDYATWLGRFVKNSAVEYWADHGHYPHLVDPDRFVARLQDFWAAT